MKSIEQQLQEKENEIRELRKKVGKSTMVQQLSESSLPEVSKARIRKRFETAESLDGVAVAIKEETEYVQKLRGRRTTETAEAQSVREAVELKQHLVDGYRSMGLSEKEAKLAANVEDKISDLQEAERGLYGAAKAMGMSESEAEHFAEGPNRRLTSW